MSHSHSEMKAMEVETASQVYKIISNHQDMTMQLERKRKILEEQGPQSTG